MMRRLSMMLIFVGLLVQVPSAEAGGLLGKLFGGDDCAQCESCDTCESCDSCEPCTTCEPCAPVTCCPEPCCEDEVVCRKVCHGKAKMVPVKKTCYDYKCKDICIPRITFPWQKDKCGCCQAPCGRVRTVKVFTKKEYECGEECKYEFEVKEECKLLPKKCCEPCCPEPCSMPCPCEASCETPCYEPVMVTPGCSSCGK